MMSHSGLMSSWRSIRPPLQDRRSTACEGRVGDAGSGLHPARVGRVRTMVRPSLWASRLWFAGLFMMLILLVVERPPHGDPPAPARAAVATDASVACVPTTRPDHARGRGGCRSTPLDA